MKKVLIFILTVAMLASVALIPAYAAQWNGQIDASILKEDFEAYEASDEVFSEETNPEGKPEGFLGSVYGGMPDRQQGAMIVENKVGGSKSIRFFREGFSGTQTANIRFGGFSTEYGDAEEIAVQFAFRFEKFGTHGITVLVGSDTTDPSEWGNGEKNIFAIRNNPDDGTDSPAILARDGAAAGDTLKVIKTGLKANTDYVLTAVFKLGSDQYSVVLNGEVIGTYTYHEKMEGISALRIDEHGYSEITDETEQRIKAQDIVFIDDIQIGTVSASGGSSNLPTPSPTQKPGNNPTGDNSDLLFAVVMLLSGITAFVVLRKKVYG